MNKAVENMNAYIRAAHDKGIDFNQTLDRVPSPGSICIREPITLDVTDISNIEKILTYQQCRKGKHTTCPWCGKPDSLLCMDNGRHVCRNPECGTVPSSHPQSKVLTPEQQRTMTKEAQTDGDED